MQNLTNLTRKASALSVATVLVCLLWAGGVVASSAPPEVTSVPTQPHVMVVVDENTEYGGIIGSSNAPYINSLATTYASAASWFAVQHNSLNDYLELLSGSNQGLPSVGPYSATTLVDELHTNGIPWQAYLESMPSTNCYPGGATANGLYNPTHNPFRYFTNYNSNQAAGWCSSANLSTEGVVPYPGSGALVSALNGANAPDFVWITPNDCHNMHGDTNAGSTCASSTASQLTQAGDTWLSSNIGPVISSPWFSQNGVIIITWDEGTSMQGCCGLTAPGGRIATVVVTPNNKGLGKFMSSGDHYGTLAAIEKAYGVPLLLNSASSVNGDLTGAFGQPAGGSISGTVTDTTTSAAISGATISDGVGGSITSNASGYTLNNVAPGTYTLTASATGYTTQSAPTVTVTAGATTTQNFALLPQPGTISGKVTDFVTGVGISPATVSYTGPGGSSGSATTAVDGTYALRMLPEGSYTVSAVATGYSSQTDTVKLAPGATAAQNFALAQAGRTIPCTGVGTTLSPPSPAIVGNPVTVSSTAYGCPSPLYEFWVRTPDLVWHLALPYSTASTYDWNTLDTQIGNYILEVLVKNTGSLGAYDAFTSMPFSMQLCDTPTLSTGAATSPYASGSGSITLTASVNCAGGAQYEFWYQDPSATFHLIGSGYGAGNTAQWSADFKAGSYNLLVEVRPVGSNAAYVTYKFLAFTLTGCGAPTLAPDKTSPQVAGTLVTWTATVTCSGSPNYKFYVQSPAGVWSVGHDWSATATFLWPSPAIAGVYHVQLWVRNAGAVNDPYDNFTTAAFTLGLCDTPTLTTGATTSPYASGSGPITLTTSASCAGGAQYEFWYQDPAATFHLIGSGYGAGNTAQWSADFKAGSYNLLVEVRPVGSSAAYVTYKFLAFTLTGCGAPTLTPDKGSPQAHGTPITWTATATCSGTANYKFYVQSPAGVFALARDWNATATFPWTPATPGTYHVQLWVRNAGAVNDLYDNYTTMTFTIT